MIFVVDTDILSLLGRDAPEASHIRRRIVELPADDSVVTTIINYEEQMRGWMPLIGGAKTPTSQVATYSRLLDHLTTFRRMAVLAYTDAAAVWFDRLKRQRLAVGTIDLRIASISLASAGVLITRNKRDFERIPGLQVSDWASSNEQ